jgi:deoxyribose-phosphate aldolase
MTRDEWHRERMEQERLEDAQVEAREEVQAVMCAVILASAFREMLKALEPKADTVIPFPLGSDGAW